MKALILEDEPALGEAVSAMLKSKGYSVELAADIQAAKNLLRLARFDVGLFDLGLPDGSGDQLIAEMRLMGNQLPILIMTARDQVSDRIRGLNAGADDYVVKPFHPDELIARIQAVLRRYGSNPSPTLALGNLVIDRIACTVVVNGQNAHLSAKEWAVLDKLISRPGTLVTKQSLEETLYSFDDDVGSNTLEVYVSRLRKKIGKEAIQTVRGLGYRFIQESV